MESKHTVLQLRNINKTYRKSKVLKEISFSLRRGGIYALIGQNGAGKTTIMRVITSLVPFDSGERVFGISDKRSIGAIIEKPALYMDLTAIENIRIVELMKGIHDDPFAEELADFFEIADKHKKVKDFSLGMKQKLGIVLALIGQPELLILDEPFNGLDPISMIQIREFLKKLSEEKGITILISSHLLSELFKFATDYIFIDKGTVKKRITYYEILEVYGEEHDLEQVYLELLGDGRYEKYSKK